MLHGRLHALGPGKDSTAGHWELMGVSPAHAPPSYPGGFSTGAGADVAGGGGHGVICNRAYNGIAAIDDFGVEHLRAAADPLHLAGLGACSWPAHVDVMPAERALRGVRARAPDGRRRMPSDA